MRSTFIFVIAITLLAGCESKPANNISSTYLYKDYRSIDNTHIKQIKILKEAIINSDRIGLIERIPAFESDVVNDLVTVDYRGYLYVGDLQQNQIHIFNSAGLYLRSVGQNGRGPGDFLSIDEIKVNGKHLIVIDLVNVRQSTFDLNNYKLINIKNISFDKIKLPHYFPQEFHIINSDSMIIGLKLSPNMYFNEVNIDSVHYYLYSSNKYNKFLFRFRDRPVYLNTKSFSIYSFEFDPKSILLSTHEYLIHIDTEYFLIKYFNFNGVYSHSYYLKDIETPELEITSFDNGALNALSNSNLKIKIDKAKNIPKIRNALIDNNYNIWISTFTSNHNILKWYIMSNNGKLLGYFYLNKKIQIREVKDEYFYAVDLNFETSQKLIKYSWVL